MTEVRTTMRWGRVPAWWLRHPEVDADRFCVLAALATYADEHGVCVPSQATLAQQLRRSRPWVNRVVAQLAAAGLLEKVQRSRGNGGTTSCLYRLRLTPTDSTARDTNVPATCASGDAAPPLPKPAQATPDASVTGPVPHADYPCQGGDTNHLYLEHNNTPAPRAAVPGHDDDAGEIGSGTVDAGVPLDWEPSAAEIAEALRLCPDANLQVHTARFRARCRARGYRYRTGHLGDAWLAWLLEDHATPSRRGDGRTPSGPRPAADRAPRRPLSPIQPSPALRFAAWAAAATVPPGPAQAASPWS